MKGVKTALQNAQEIKETLQEKELLDTNKKVKKTDSSIIFPVQQKVSLNDAEIVEASFEDRTDQTPNDLKEILKETVPASLHDKITKSYDVIGDIVIIDIDEALDEYKEAYAEAILQTNNHVRSVYDKVGKHKGVYRIQELQHIGGEDNTVTIHKENNVRLKVDVAQVYFSPRLASERLRVAKQVDDGENVLVMFSGCGPYNVVIDEYAEVEENIGVEINPTGHDLAIENKKMNKLSNAKFYLGDVRDVLPMFDERFDRIIMPLPKRSEEYLELALQSLQSDGVIHLYKFLSTSDVDGFKHDLAENDAISSVEDVVRCGDHSPDIHRYCFDLQKQ